MRGGAVALVAIAALLASIIGAGGGGDQRRHGSVSPQTTTEALPPTPPADRRELAADLDRAQQTIDDPASASAEIAGAGRFEQLATVTLDHQPPSARRSIFAALSPSAAATMRANIAAATALSRLVTPRRSLPPWRIVAPPPPDTLLGYFKLGQSRFGVPWRYLAAIEFVETKFGRVVGPSTAGAQGPMQFLPATWAQYGRGDIHNARDAILGAARYLVANGAPGDMADALFHYNPSTDYVAAIRDYAGRMQSDRRAYYGDYNWQVIYSLVGGPVILPVGYPRVRPVRVRWR